MKKLVIKLGFVFILLSGCITNPTSVISTPRPTPPFIDTNGITGETVQMLTADGLTLHGTLYGEGEVGVILAHMGLGSTNQKSWQPFAKELANLGYTALAFDFRGRGVSQGPFISSNLKLDVDAAVALLKDRGVKKVVCIGASMGGTACLRSVIDDHLDGLVMIASPFSLGTPTYTSPYELEMLTIPSLFITATDDQYSNEIDMKVMAAKVAGPSDLVIYDGVSEHGTDLRDRLEKFLSGITP